MNKCALYCRCSTDEQASSGHSLEIQEARLTEYAKANGLHVVEIIVDDGYSGKNLKRQGITRLLDLCSSKSIDAVLITKLDRLSRNLSNILLLVETFQRHKIAIHSLQEKLDTSSYVGLFVVHILGALAEMERQMIVSRTRDAMKHLKQNGRRISRYSPYGYDFDQEGKVLVPNSSELQTVNLVMDAHREGFNYSKIARKLEKLSVPSRTNHKWHPEQIRRIVFQFNEGVGL